MPLKSCCKNLLENTLIVGRNIIKRCYTALVRVEDNMKKFKKALTVDEQIEHLKKNKRVVFNQISETEAKEFLYRNKYMFRFSLLFYKQ